MAKYKLTDDIIQYEGHTLYRIIATTKIGTIPAGTRGGYIESEYNLSQDGTCWVSDNAHVYGNARVSEDAIVRDSGRVKDSAIVSGHAIIANVASVSDHARVKDNAYVCDQAIISGNATITDNAIVGHAAVVDGNAEIGKHALVTKRDDYILIEHINYDLAPRMTIYAGCSKHIRIAVGKFDGTLDECWRLIKRSRCPKKQKLAFKHIFESAKLSMGQ